MEGKIMDQGPFVITISHQIGSGGSYIGKKLAERLSVPFIDRQILKWVADQLHVSEATLEGREERVSSFWDSFAHLALLTDPMESFTRVPYMPTDHDMFDLESEYIAKIAQNSSAVILGRCGRYVLRDHQHRFSLLTVAPIADRVQRTMKQQNLGQPEAERFVENNDRERATYLQTFTKQNWLEAQLYDLCVNTSTFGLDAAVDLVLAQVTAKPA
jgi:cytidylate kinase